MVNVARPLFSLRLLFLVVFLSTLIFDLFAQTVSFHDIETGNPISNVAIYNNDNTMSVVSGRSGNASLNIFAEDDTLLIQHASYMELIYLKSELEDLGYVVSLSKRVLQLQEIVLSSSKFQEKREDIVLTMEVLSAANVSQFEPVTSADLLSSEGTVMVQKSQLGGGSPVLRGFEANKILLVVDGVRMNNAIYRSGHLQNAITIDQASLESVEVIFGPGAVIYGSDAMGGVIHFFTKKPKYSKKENNSYTNASALIRYSSALKEQTTHFDFNIGYKKVAFLTSITNSRFGDLLMGSKRKEKYPDFGKVENYVFQTSKGTDSLIENPNPNVHVGTGYSQVGVLQKVIFKPINFLELELNAQYSTTSNIPRFDKLNDKTATGLKYAEWHYGPQERVLTSLKLNLLPANSWFDKASMLVAYQKITEERITRKFNDFFRTSRNEVVDVYSANIDFKKDIDNFRSYQYGIEATYNNVISSASTLNISDSTKANTLTRYPDGGSTMQSYSGYVSYNWILSPISRLKTGVRYTNVLSNASFIDTLTYQLPYNSMDNNSSAFNGSIGLLIGVGKPLRIRGLLSSGFRAPNIDDLGKVFAKEDYVTVPNPGLVPEKIYSGELSLEGKMLKGGLKIDVTGFYSFLTDAIVKKEYKLNGQDSLDYDGEKLKVLANKNVSKAIVYGSTFGITAVWKEFRLKGSATYTYGNEIIENLPMSHIPPLFGKVSFLYDVMGNQWISPLKFLIYSDFNGWKKADQYGILSTDNFSEATLDGTPSWYTINTSFSYFLGMVEKEVFGTKFIPGSHEASGIKFQFSIQNLLDTHYKPFASGISGAGRNFVISLRVSLE